MDHEFSESSVSKIYIELANISREKSNFRGFTVNVYDKLKVADSLLQMFVPISSIAEKEKMEQ